MREFWSILLHFYSAFTLMSLLTRARSDWCNLAFLNSTAAKALNLPADFNIRTYPLRGTSSHRIHQRTTGFDPLCDSVFRSRYLAAARAKFKTNATALVQDPVAHAYSLSQYASQADAWARIMQRVKQAAVSLGRELTPLVYGNSWGLWGQSPASTLISQRTDIVWAESCSLQDRVTDWHSLWTGRPAMNAWSALMYKVGLASGDWHKPVWFFADDVSNPAMAELWQSEGIANGGLSVLLHIDAVLRIEI